MASGSSSKKNKDVVIGGAAVWNEGGRESAFVGAAAKEHARQNPRTGTFNFSHVPPRRPSE